MIEKDKYSIDLQEGKKMMHIKVWGFFKQEDAQDFIEDYKGMVSKINPEKYTLAADSTGLKTSPRENIPLLKSCMKMYMDDNFDNIAIINPDNRIAKNQAKRVARECDFTGSFVDSYKEAQQL